MPIYEFRCLECGNVFDLLFKDPGEKVEIKCPNCNCNSIKRIISKTNYAMGTGKNSKKPKVTTKSCGPGSKCMTMEVPGIGD